jgi:hypothetical protein
MNGARVETTLLRALQAKKVSSQWCQDLEDPGLACDQVEQRAGGFEQVLLLHQLTGRLEQEQGDAKTSRHRLE